MREGCADSLCLYAGLCARTVCRKRNYEDIAEVASKTDFTGVLKKAKAS
jgi:hypothetical protein